MARKGSRDDDDMSDDDGDFEDEVEEGAEDESDTSPKKSNKRRKNAAFEDSDASEEVSVTTFSYVKGNSCSLSAQQVPCTGKFA